MGSAAYERCHRLAERQDGLLTRHQAMKAGLSRHQIATEVRTGRWVEIQPKVFGVSGTPLTWRRAVRACVLSALDHYDPDGDGPDSRQPPRVVASHSTAAAMLGLDRATDTSTIEVSGVGLQLPVLGGVAVHRTRALDRCDVRWVDGIPVTSGARTLIDLAARLDPVTLTALLDDAVCAHVVARRGMYRRASTLHRGRRGVTRLIRLTGPGAEGEFRSWLERRAYRRAIDYGLPPPLVNYPLRVGGKLLGVIDNFWIPGDLPVEWDGLRYHSSPSQQRRDRERDRKLTLAGYPPLRYSWLDLEERPDEVMAEIAQALRARGVSF